MLRGLMLNPSQYEYMFIDDDHILVDVEENVNIMYIV